MASLFDFLFDSLPFAVAHHGAWLDTDPGRRTTVRKGLERASLATLRRQMVHLGTGRPPILQNPPRSTPDAFDSRLGPLWSLHLDDSLDRVGRGTCRVEDQNDDEVVVFDRIAWGREAEGGLVPSVLAELRTTARTVELPLEASFLLGEWLIHAQRDVPEKALDLYPVQTRLDLALARVFLFELDSDSGRLHPFTPVDDEEAAGLARYRRAARLLDALATVPSGQEPFLGEELCALEPFPRFEDLADISGTIGFDDAVRFAVTRPRFLVVTSLALCRKTYDFEPGGMLGVAKLHPNILTAASTIVTRWEAAVRVERPARTTNLSRPGHCACSEMLDEIKPLVVADTNHDEMLAAVPFVPPPFWGNLFAYYRVDPHVAWPGRSLQMVRPASGERTAAGLVTRSMPAGPMTLTSDLSLKVAGQGEFDNVHLAPRMHLRAATHVRRSTGVLPTPWVPALQTPWRLIGPADHLELDEVAMAPVCAHDCLHFHARWGDDATALQVLGWARDPELVEAATNGDPAILARCGDRVSKPNTEAGAAMFPPWQDCRLRFLDGHRVQLSSTTIAPTLPGQREIFFHAPWAYGVAVGTGLQTMLATLLTASEVSSTEVQLGRANPAGGVDWLSPGDSWAALYWQLRHDRVVYSESEYAAEAYHVERDLDAAIGL